MFCPHCGLEEQQPKQFCRACGADLRVVRTAINRSEEFATTLSAHEEIGHAFAAKIKEMNSAKDLKRIAEETLPQIEKFLASPEEKRLRRIRAGVTTTVLGLAAIFIGIALSRMTQNPEFAVFSIMGLVPCLLGLGIVLNGLLFSTPRKREQDTVNAVALVNSLRSTNSVDKSITNELTVAETTLQPTSITEHTTHQLPRHTRQ